jgi:hypothetical protein
MARAIGVEEDAAMLADLGGLGHVRGPVTSSCYRSYTLTAPTGATPLRSVLRSITPEPNLIYQDSNLLDHLNV